MINPKCLHCGSAYLHHDTVQVFDRREDAEMVNVTMVSGGVSAMSMVPHANRRGGIAVEFGCEECAGISILTIAQHKGKTEMEWA